MISYLQLVVSSFADIIPQETYRDQTKAHLWISHEKISFKIPFSEGLS